MVLATNFYLVVVALCLRGRRSSQCTAWLALRAHLRVKDHQIYMRKWSSRLCTEQY